MTYEITWKSGASRDMAALPLRIASAVVEFVYGPLAENPYRVGKALRFELEGKHSARRGNYRVVYEIFDTRVEVQNIAVRHRADAYR
jgi:mRNA interferase RelE/StbE